MYEKILPPTTFSADQQIPNLSEIRSLTWKLKYVDRREVSSSSIYIYLKHEIFEKYVWQQKLYKIVYKI